MNFHYCYLITNILTKQQYVGDRSCNCDMYNDKYMGSGTDLKIDMLKYGKINFIKEILENFPSRYDAYIAQEKYIRLYETHTSQGGYNRSWTGGPYWKGRHSEKTKEKLRIIMKEKAFRGHRNNEGNRSGYKHSLETKKKMSDSMKGKNLGRKLSDDVKQRMRDSFKGIRKGIKKGKMSDEHKKRISESLKGKTKGKIISEETRNKMSIAQKLRLSKTL
jgi:hypothetical protein